ncbi:hypothetical protein DPMN_081294 [Dreissena polymorpha]|uniref:Uncharacterized protein n=1 Tax=Dreissena polymorpha TaxID=45954 RepID=A0A9D3Y8N2_DREPO|nr:hypothetical protein DPMN_081294 [Dreissena polymorpha]
MMPVEPWCVIRDEPWLYRDEPGLHRERPEDNQDGRENNRNGTVAPPGPIQTCRVRV